MQEMKSLDKNFLLILIILIASLLRLVNLDTNPPSLYGDELTMVYDAYSLAQTGFDQKGERLPLVFKLGGSRPPGYVYATVPFAAIFGPTPFAARIVSVLAGVGLVFLLYLLGRRLFNFEVGLAAAFLGAIAPWGISLSRAGFESNLALFLATFGVFAFLKGLERPFFWFLSSAFSFGLSIQTYPTYRMVIPLFLLFLGYMYRNELKKIVLSKNYIQLCIPASILILSVILSVYLTFFKVGDDRFSSMNIFYGSSSPITNSPITVTERGLIGFPNKLGYIFHNKAIEIVGLLTRNYLDNISLGFLFFEGDGLPRHNPAGIGELYWGMLILIIFGIRWLIKVNTRLLRILTGWILISPLAGSLLGGAHAIRSSFMLVPLLIISAVGVGILLKNRFKLLFILSIFIFGQFIFFTERIFFLAPKANANFWSYSAKRAASIAQKNKNDYKFIFVSNDIPDMEYAYPTYNKIDPRKVIEQNKKRVEIQGYKFFRYDNVYIGSLPKEKIIEFLANLSEKVLYIGPFEESKYLNGPDIIYGLDNLPMLAVVKKGVW